MGCPSPSSRSRLVRLAWALAFVAPFGVDEGSARAEFGQDRFEIQDISAWTLRSGELLVGPRELAIGFFDVFSLGTNAGLNLFGALNADLKWLIHDDARVGIGVKVGFVHFDPGLVGLDETFEVTAFPLSFLVSGRPNEDLRLHGAIEFLSARPDERAPDAILRLQRHLGGVAKLSAKLGAEYRFGQHVAAVLQLETPLSLHREAFRYEGEDSVGDFVRVGLSFHFVVESFNLRVGGGYGPSILGRAGFFPIAELGFRIF